MKKILMTALLSTTAFAPAIHAAENNLMMATATNTVQETQSYEAVFFAPYTPQTALDMINRLPGFLLDSGTEARGFGATAGNVLVDGARPANKAGGIEEVLTRIPAAQVARIEVRIGANSAGETAGQTMVANIIRKKDTSTGTWTAALHSMDGGIVRPSFDANFSTKLGAWEATVKLDTSYERYDREAVITSSDAQGQTTGTAAEVFRNGPKDISLSFDASRPAFGGKLQLNGMISREDWIWDNDRLSHDLTDDRLTTATIDGGWQNYSGEFGADWSRKLDSGWNLRLLGLFSMNDERSEDNTTSGITDGALDETGLFVSDWTFTETIVRTTMGKAKGKLKPEFGIEGALNTMKNRFHMLITDGDGLATFAPDDSRADVREYRAEAFGNVIYDAGKRLTLNAGLRAEVSRISSGPDTARSFTYLKPSAGINYKVSEKLQLGISFRRSVGQLSFADFAASNDALDGRVFEGNANLRPDRTDRLEATLDYRLNARSALSVELFHDWKKDVLEQVVLDGGGTGIANTGSARQWGATAKATVGLDGFIKGGLLDLRLYLKDSTYTDPVTNLARNLSDEFPLVWSASFRQDISGTKWSYGATYNSKEERDLYYPADRSHYTCGERVSAFVETSQFFGVKTRLSVNNIFGDDLLRERDYFTGDRTGAFSSSEVKDYRRNATFKLTVSGKF
ncbi:MAG: outer membrane beta-barrel protein [Alphaproteobacteria bacterium]|nr:outer membrane beta-barrel protein [Alphaproteobacteria bacterium]